MAISTAVDASAVARVVGIRTEFVDLRGGRVTLLPQRIAVIGQGNTASTYPTTKLQVTSALQAGQVYGFGSPIHLAVEQLLPFTGDGVGSIPVTVYPLEDDSGGAASTGVITPTGNSTGAGSFRLVVNGIPSNAFSIASGTTPEQFNDALTVAVNGTLVLPVAATDNGATVSLVSKWMGTSANQISISVEGPTDIGVTVAITQPSGGTVDPDVDDSLNQFGMVWETLVLNCLDPVAATLDKYSLFNEGRWGPLMRRPFVAFSGSNEPIVTAAITIPNARGRDRTNCQLVAPGSVNLPLVIAARQLARIAALANNNPPRDYGSQNANGLIPGTDAQQWTYVQRDQAVKGGSSTVEVRDGVVVISDVVTFYAPEGDVLPPYRFVVDIIKLQNIIFNVDLIFNTPAWDGAPLIPNDQPTTNRSARKPKDAIAAVNSLLDNLGLEAIISDPETAKSRTRAGISTQNPKRLDIQITAQVSGNDNITSIDLFWGFFFGTAPIL